MGKGRGRIVLSRIANSFRLRNRLGEDTDGFMLDFGLRKPPLAVGDGSPEVGQIVMISTGVV